MGFWLMFIKHCLYNRGTLWSEHRFFVVFRVDFVYYGNLKKQQEINTETIQYKRMKVKKKQELENIMGRKSVRSERKRVLSKLLPFKKYLKYQFTPKP